MRIAHLWFRISRGMTLGVRAIVLDAQGSVFLVRHTYVPGWHLPGGGVETGQSVRDALNAELREEGNIYPQNEPELLGVYLNTSASRRDHVVVFVIRHFTQTGPRLPDREIAEAGFFALDALPAKTTLGTRRRLQEFTSGSSPATHW